MREGAYVVPTIFEVYDNRQEMMQEEIFAPVVGILKVRTPDEAIDYVNDCATDCALRSGRWITVTRFG
jgi:acyl-CoA reductase-like NAD-dependent aldehyde dehydrogenase